MKWTDKQLEAIESFNKNILVAAAAGSGKTAVLVERIIQKILKHNIDIDKLLVVTFTNAAASEIRQRVLEAIYSKLDLEPENENLQKQIILLNKSNISTIHSFCLSIIKNNFYKLGIAPDFRIGDSAELEILKLDTLDEVFEELYEKNDKNFIKLTDIYTGYHGDEKLKELILKIYNFIQSAPFPIDWLKEQVVKFNLKDKINEDFSNTIWGKIILKDIKENIENNITELKVLYETLNKDEDLKKYSDVILLDIEEYEKGLRSLETWDKAYNIINSLEFKRWPTDKKIESDLKENANKIRSELNKKFKKIRSKYLVSDSLNINNDISEMYNVLVYLQDIVIKFTNMFKTKKLNKNIIDFNDIEHFALEILIEKDELSNKYVPTKIAEEYRNKFEEIAIDEYQDSNLVQEYILSTISNGHNMFMVGDVKQSIYRFRQARPELFLEKYNKFKLKNEIISEDNYEDMKIQLFNNFRSRDLVLDFANLVFENIMSKEVGDIDYNEEEFLNFTALFSNPIEKVDYAGKMSLELIDLSDFTLKEDSDEDDETYDEVEDEDSNENIIEEIQENLEKIEIEARYVAYRIKEILESKYNVYDKELKDYRPATYKDFVILLRSTSIIAPIFEKEILKLNLPVYSDSSQKYLESIEIETILNLLKIIDNPMQDIPLVSVLRSYIGGFNDNELLSIRLNNIKNTFYESLISIKEREDIDSELKNKVNQFLNNLTIWQRDVNYISLDEFIWKLYIETGFYNYVSMMNDGERKVANLKMLFERAKQYDSGSFKGLYNFIKFIDKLKKNQGEMDSAKIIGENDNVIRIMSIHKSKGLEFPIVFLSGIGKKFNLTDLNDNILLHQDLGLGPKYINFDRKIEYSTMAKEALKIKLKNDSLSEEMRILYVALTRPKEKLIITGTDKNIKKKLEEKSNLIKVSKSKRVNSILVKKYTSYLDWIELAYLNDMERMNNCINVNLLDLNKLIKKYPDFNVEIKEAKNDLIKYLSTCKFDNKEYEKIESFFKFKYIKEELTKINSKLSVSSIKEFLENKEHSKKSLDIQKKEFVLNKPTFIEDKNLFSKAYIGTLTHLIFQKLDFNKKYNKEEISREINSYVDKEILTIEERKLINDDEVFNFINSKFASRIRSAKKIYRELPFYMNFKASIINKEIEHKDYDDEILVQGIIDLYFEEDDGKLVLVDYKTDYITKMQEDAFINKHKEQLLLYKLALENATKKEVKEMYLYSTSINKEIKIEI